MLPLTGSYQLVLSLRALVDMASDSRVPKRNYCSSSIVHRRLLFIGKKNILFFEFFFTGVLFMASGDSDPDAKDALSKLLQMGKVVEYQNEFEMLINRNIKEKADTTLSLPSEEASLVVKGPLDANEDTFLSLRSEDPKFSIQEKTAEYVRALNAAPLEVVFVGPVDEVSSAIDDVFDIGESNMESMRVHSNFAEFFESKESAKKVLSAAKLPDSGNSHLTYSPYHLEGQVNFEGVEMLRPEQQTSFGSNFNVHEAKKFNSFIYNAGMEEVSLGGSAFTWCHRSASKMSKLDRFFVSENLLTSCPNISAITLERFISDHRPILLRETSFNYVPIPFRFYKYWLEVDGFDKMIRESWEAAPGNKDNDKASKYPFNFKEFLRIRVWLSIHKENSRSDTDILKEELRLCDELIDKGMGSSEVVQNRLEILNKIHQVQKNQASEISQKAKIKWAIEGDENVKFFHGILNKM
ncbi:RNA-directed DNA polymerase, eukaryota [Tanacetum coccineum]